MNTPVFREFTATAYPNRKEPPAHALRIQLAWTPDNPFAVTLSFPGHVPALASWLISRELLEQGLRAPTGIGDVRCRLDACGYVITLLGSHGQDGMNVDIQLRPPWVIDFLARTAGAPDSWGPHGDEFDEQVAQLLTDDAA